MSASPSTRCSANGKLLNWGMCQSQSASTLNLALAFWQFAPIGVLITCSTAHAGKGEPRRSPRLSERGSLSALRRWIRHTTLEYSKKSAYVTRFTSQGLSVSQLGLVKKLHQCRISLIRLGWGRKADQRTVLEEERAYCLAHRTDSEHFSLESLCVNPAENLSQLNCRAVWLRSSQSAWENDL